MIQEKNRQASLFNEQEWLRALFMLSDMEAWLSEMEKKLFMSQPSGKKKKLFRKTYYLTASSFAHIIERHYYKVPRHIGAAKFTITIPEILDCLRMAFEQPPVPLPGSINFLRTFNAGTNIGFDRSGTDTSIITIISDAGGKIVTAFPGLYNQQSPSSGYRPDNDSEIDTISIVQEDELIYLTKTRTDRLLQTNSSAVLN